MNSDYRKANKLADEVLLCAESIKSFPFSIEEVIKECTDIELVQYSELRKLGGNAEMIVGSKDGALHENNGRYILFYNEAMPKSRSLFTLGHELGHYHLGHDIKTLDEYKRNHDERFKELYDKCEKEANLFSAQLYTPYQVIKELAKRGCKITTEFLQEHFGVSNQCAKVRISNLCYQKNGEYDDLILAKFKQFIDTTAKRTSSFSDEFEREYEMQRLRESW